MPLILAAIRTGHDPVGKLPEAAFHHWMDTQLTCPKCDATYNLVVAYYQSVGRFFEEESRRPIAMLKKAIFLGHAGGHRVAHFESAGVVVTSFGAPEPAKAPPQPPARPNLKDLPLRRPYRIH
jgi:hypothetical protein